MAAPEWSYGPPGGWPMLGGSALPPGPKTVEVRDRKNPERVLGRLVKRPLSEIRDSGEYLRMMVREPMALRGPPSDYLSDTLRGAHLTFHISYRATDGGWTKQAVLLTDDPLGVLQWHPDFRLPGETEQQANYRHMLA